MLLIPDDIFAIVTIWQEARGEIHIGKVAVGEVIRNRMKMRYHSDGTAAGTVLQPRQFSGWNEGNYNRIISVKQDAQDPAMMDCARAWLESDAGIDEAPGSVKPSVSASAVMVEAVPITMQVP